MTHATDGEPWLDALLRDAQPAALDDGGFSDGVLARLAAPVATLPADAALAALRRAERNERRHVRWTVGGALVGTIVAVAATLFAGGAMLIDASAATLPVLALFAVSCGLAAVALSPRASAPAW